MLVWSIKFDDEKYLAECHSFGKYHLKIVDLNSFCILADMRKRGSKGALLPENFRIAEIINKFEVQNVEIVLEIAKC